MLLFVLRGRTMKKDATTVAFHLRNANIALERIETTHGRTIHQEVLTAGLRRALNRTIRRADALLAELVRDEEQGG